MAGDIHDDARAYNLARERGARSAGNEADFVLLGKADKGANVFLGLGNGHGQRHFLIGGGIRGVEKAEHPIGINVT